MLFAPLEGWRHVEVTDWMAETYPNRKFFGFNSFRGLPEDWTGYKTFQFDREGVTPQLPDNVELVVGLFEDTLPKFAMVPRSIAMLHIDCDLYVSANAVLPALEPFLLPGTILVFDEYFNYPGFRAMNTAPAPNFWHARAVRSNGSVIAVNAPPEELFE